MRVLPLFNKFNSGEITPRLYAQSDLVAYQTGLQTAKNVVPYMHGTINRRAGTEFVEFIDFDFARCFAFQYRLDAAFLVFVDTTDIYIFDKNGLVHKMVGISPYGSEGLKELQGKMIPSGKALMLTTPAVTPSQVTYDPTQPTPATQWSYSPIAFTSPPPEWVAGNYPSVVTFFQARTWWAGTPEQPDRFWASKVNAYFDLTLGAAADDALDYSLAEYGRIEWMAGIRNLIIGTENGEYIVTGQDGFVGVGNIRVEKQSSHGSDNLPSLEVGNKALYISRDGAKLWSINYLWTDEGWASRDIIFTSEHFKNKGRMRYMAFAKNPESIIWIVTDTGLLFSCTYDDQTGIYGWAEHETQGIVIDVEVIEERGISVVYIAVIRLVGIVPTVFLERFTPDTYMDSSAKITHVSPSNQITGITHLADQEVQVTVDGAVVPNVLLDGSGNGVAEYAGLEIVVGLPYVSTIKTLPFDQGSTRGSAMSLKKRWNRIFIRMIESANPIINGDRPPSRTPSTPMNTPEPVRSTDIDVRDVGWTQTGEIEIIQDLPLPLRISGIFGEMNQNYIE